MQEYVVIPDLQTIAVEVNYTTLFNGHMNLNLPPTGTSLVVVNAKVYSVVLLTYKLFAIVIMMFDIFP